MIGYYAHHHGAGHLTRLQAIAGAMNEDVWGLSSTPAPAAWTGGWTQLARDDDPDPAALSADGDPTAHGVLHWAPRGHLGLARRSAQLANWVVEEHPRALVVDVSVEVAVLARLCGVPTVVVALPGARLDRTHQLAYDSAEALLAPWPRGTHDRDWPSAWTAKTWFVGGISRFDHLSPSPPVVPPSTHGRTVLVLWGAGGRTTTAADVDAARAATPTWTWVERVPGVPGDGSIWEALASADVVVTHGGQNAVAEVAAARRPAVVVAQPRPFDEQVATARAVESRQIAVGLSAWPSADEWPDLLERAISRGGAGWAQWSTGHGAAVAAAHLRTVGLPSPLPA
ncbi:Glycosyltransferase family 28 C-terminal domain-containing protein [Pedococcus dokdonensis]|uniref:Glycosyltransferase family 28 C-terminal domain-containing protein n=1 Tax=Pedococcus dokdonensis TaxID=443156 RepID=A0A1H0MA29_9MICO|nr:glycosyltransferase [Pedococcus dokdonensis]SDO77283.1 Glycosyltransferase family 28 C-terminal domain-containing protein [Pedococcus dokdonensis]